MFLRAAWQGCRGFVREAGKEGEEGRPLPALVEVAGINFSVPASATFGDFYRCGLSLSPHTPPK